MEISMKQKNKNFYRIVSIFFYLAVLIIPPDFCLGENTGVIQAETSQVVIDNSAPKPSSGNVTINFKEVDINTVLNYLSEIGGVDIIPSPGIDAKVTIKLRDKPWEVALDIVTRNYGYAYSRDDERKIIRVMPKAMLQNEEVVTEVILLNYITESPQGTQGAQGAAGPVNNVTQLIDAVKSIINEKSGEKVIFLSSANAIVVSAIPARIAVIKDMVAKVDKKIPQIMLEAKVLEVTLDKNDQFGIDWNAIISASGARRPTTVPFTSQGLLKFLPGGQREYYPSSNVLGGGDSRTNFTYIDDTQMMTPTAAQTADSVFSYGTLDFSQFGAVLRMIDQLNDINILSSPRITTLNNQSAVIKVINNVYLQKQVKATDTANTVTVEFEKEPRETGVILEVTPHVNDNREITVNLKPQVSTVPSFQELQVNGNQNTVAMTYNSREANTQVMVKDGETIFIGGLIRETSDKQDNDIPGLGKMFKGIPLLGSIFNYKQKNIDKTEVVFFVTVHILENSKDSLIKSNTLSQCDINPASSLNAYTDDKSKKDSSKNISETGKVKNGKITEHKKVVPVAAESGSIEKEKPVFDFRKKK
ncbi:general secretion pathway protein D [Candidatus Omnitrophus magneticus]|uniref:General secretion pathway protein D n=1 Tax=Candidatus Omnitrophus magneticus TaxID=1609969 RepID=A0A0F0CUX9_9BACT|nr:general secretion pathway protein D [Candidatus Omnitrophus magneticus]